MDIHGSGRFRHRKSPPSSDRFLDAFFSAAPPPHTNNNTSSSSAAAEDSELHEDDIFSTGDFSSSDSPRIQQHNHLRTASPRHKAFPDSFGILAVLPENRIAAHHHHHLYQKTALSSSPSTSPASSSSNSSSSRLIPKPPQDRFPIPPPFSSSSSSPSFSKHQHPQSAPINVPVLSAAMARRRHKEFDEIDEMDEDEGGEMLPPHEIVARTQSPILSCPVLEGAGRTLKGRDLRQVRNAIWRQTGFLD